MINYGELFAGHGTGALAMSMVFNDECSNKFFSEIKKQRVKVYHNHFPNHKNIGDIDFVQIDRLPNIDFVLGGSPCSDLSVARTNREGLDGDQSGLFYKFLDVVREKKPKYFLLENVASMKNEDKDEISRCLGVKPVKISSRYFTGQNRERYYWANFPIEKIPTKQVDPRWCIDKKDKPDMSLGEILFSGDCTDDEKKDWKLLHNVYYHGKKMGKSFIRDHKSDWDFVAWSRSTRYVEFSDGDDVDKILKDKNITRYKVKSKHPNGNIASISYVEQRIKINEWANTLVTGKHCARMSSKNFIRHGTKYRQINLKEATRLQGLPDDYFKGMSESTAYSSIGDGFTLPVIVHILQSLKKEVENVK